MVLGIIMPLSRSDRVTAMAKQLARIKSLGLDVRYLVVIDNECIDPGRFVTAMLDEGAGIDDLEIINTGNPPPYENNVLDRRLRITKVWERIQKEPFLDTVDLVLGTEDDCNFTPIQVSNLLSAYNHLKRDLFIKKLGFVTGIQAGRWGVHYLGLWKLNHPTKQEVMRTGEYRPGAVELISAAGFYFFVCSPLLVKHAKFKTNSFGVDINFGMDLTKEGYRNYAVHDIVIPHATLYGLITPGQKKICVLEYRIQEDGLWKLSSGID